MTQLANQLFNGLITGSFYALLSLGLAVIFGVLRVVNFAHGAFYMLGAFGGYLLLLQFKIGFWPALLLSPLLIGALGVVLERTLIRRLYTVDPLYNFLLTFAVSLVATDTMRLRYGVQGLPYAPPGQLQGIMPLGPIFTTKYRLFALVFAIAVCLLVWFLIERTRVGMVVRAATEKPALTRALGVDVDRWIPPVFGFGVALAALGGVLAAPIYNVSPLMGADIIVIIFAIVVIGGLGSILGAVVAGLAIGLVGALARALGYPQLEYVLIFVVMAIVLLVRPAGLFGSAEAG
jgi:branched-chain amino acid transport system permease protein